MKRALITGLTGQDGSYLAEILLEKDMKSMVLSGEAVLLIHKGLIISSTLRNTKTNLSFTMEI